MVTKILQETVVSKNLNLIIEYYQLIDETIYLFSPVNNLL